jgi:hypothetical protein
MGAIEDAYGHVPDARTPEPARTLVGRFARALHALHYGSTTSIWLNEISAFYLRSLSSTIHPQWTRAVQAKAAGYLIGGLRATAGPGGDLPIVNRIYYLRYADGTNFPYWALTVAGQPVPAYSVIANRHDPH